jgi:uncharacterized membrane-anchored protein YitT (DUF2179 family)
MRHVEDQKCIRRLEHECHAAFAGRGRAGCALWQHRLVARPVHAVGRRASDRQPRLLEIAHIHPLWSAVLGGVLLGFGLLALYRHRASLGGVGILGIYLQERFGIRAGLVQLVVDMGVLAIAFAVTTPYIVLCSVVGAVVLNIFVAINHRSDRYIAL